MNAMLKTYAIAYFEKFGFNVLPVKEKRPLIAWDVWQSKNQTVDYIEKMDWSNATGIGGVMGINDIMCFDIDAIENPELIKELLLDLGLPEDYRWLVQSGSGTGFHIYFRSLIPSPSPKEKETEESIKGVEQINLLNEIGGVKAVYKLKMKIEGQCHHLEFRVNQCQTLLPPSLHPSGGVYDFINNDPVEKPDFVNLEIVIGCLKKHCITEQKKSETVIIERQVQNSYDKKYFDEDTLLSAVEYLGKNMQSGSYDEWLKCGFACASLGEAGYKYFELMSTSNKNYNDTESEIKQKYNTLLKDYDGRITLGTLYHIAEINGWRKPFLRFWDFDDKGKLKISRTKFKKFLEREGFFKIKKDNNYLFVRSEQNSIEEFDPIYVKDFVLNYLQRIAIEELEGTNRQEIIDALMKGAGQYFVPAYFEFLVTKNPEFLRDDREKAYLFFKNCIVEVTKDNIVLTEYKRLNKYIWKRQIIDDNFYTSDEHTDFEDFQFNICRKDSKRFKALKSGMGYLIHNYKDPNNAKAIVFIDEKMSEGAFGRSGKGLVIKAIGKVRNIVTEDGRNFDIGKSFAFQRVNADTNIISIEDMKERFPFDKLFSILTEGITIEKKNKDEMYIPFMESPKVVISTNYSIKGVDDSTIDRQFIIEFSDHYNKNNRPVDEFGKLFFESWNKSEWNSFYNYMIRCLQLYLDNGLVPYAYVNLERKRLVDETCAEFAEFSDTLVFNTTYNKKDLFEQFNKEYPEVDGISSAKLTQGKFTRWIKIFARIKAVDVVESKSGSVRSIELRKMKEVA
jgi:hypothetical protein